MSKTAEDVRDALLKFVQCLSAFLHRIPPLRRLYRSWSLRHLAVGCPLSVLSLMQMRYATSLRVYGSATLLRGYYACSHDFEERKDTVQWTLFR